MKLQRDKRNRYYLINKSIRNDELNRLDKFPILNLGQYSGGLIVLKENKRVKPYNKLAARTIGYVREAQWGWCRAGSWWTAWCPSPGGRGTSWRWRGLYPSLLKNP